MKNMPPHTFAPIHTCHYTMVNNETACLSGRIILNYEYSHLLQLATIAIVYALITTELFTHFTNYLHANRNTNYKLTEMYFVMDLLATDVLTKK